MGGEAECVCGRCISVRSEEQHIVKGTKLMAIGRKYSLNGVATKFWHFGTFRNDSTTIREKTSFDHPVHLCVLQHHNYSASFCYVTSSLSMKILLLGPHRGRKI